MPPKKNATKPSLVNQNTVTINHIRVLTTFDQADNALTLLVKVAQTITPVMIRRKWKIQVRN